MIIPIDDKYRIKSDSNCWAIQSVTTRKDGTLEWGSKLYYSSFSGALGGLYELKLRLSDAVGLVEAKLAAKQILAEMTRALATPEEWQ